MLRLGWGGVGWHGVGWDDKEHIYEALQEIVLFWRWQYCYEVDIWWQSLDRFIPSYLNNKDWSKGGLNQKLILYMHAFVWRYHLPVTADLKSHLGKLKWVKTKRAATAEFTPITQTPVFYRTICCRRHKWDQVKYPRVTLFSLFTCIYDYMMCQYIRACII